MTPAIGLVGVVRTDGRSDLGDGRNKRRLSERFRERGPEFAHECVGTYESQSTLTTALWVSAWYAQTGMIVRRLDIPRPRSRSHNQGRQMSTMYPQYSRKWPFCQVFPRTLRKRIVGLLLSYQKYMKKNFLSTPLVIAIMAFAVVAFLFLIDTAINPDGSKKTSTTKVVTKNLNVNNNTNSVSATNENIVIRNGNFATNENTNNVPTTNTNEPFPVVEENPIWEVKELFSEEFKTPFNQGDISHINCNGQYCIIAATSAGWTYKIVRYENDSFTTVHSFDPQYFYKPYGLESAWNGQYWLMTSSVELLRYDGTAVTKVSLPDTNCTIRDIAWNGSVWMVVTLCNSSNPAGKIFSYDGENFRVISTDYAGVTQIAWNGSVWAFAGQRYSTANPTINKALFVTYNGTTFTDYSDKVTSMVENTVSDFVWRDRWEIAYRPNSYDSESPLLYAFDGKTLNNITNTLIGFEKAQTGFLTTANIYSIGGFKRPALNVMYKQKLLDLSSRLNQHDVHSLAAINDHTLLVGSDGGNIIQIEFIQD